MDWLEMATAQPAVATVPQALRRAAVCCELGVGDTLAWQGDPVRRMLCVISGELRLVRRDRGGAEIILQRSRGGFFAEASLQSNTYHCDIVAAADTLVLCFPVENFRQALEEDKPFRNAWMTHLSCEVRKLRSQCERLSLHSAADRILHYLESEGWEGRIVLSQSRKAWAAELGLTHEALYRTLKRLGEEGVLSIDGPQIAVNVIRSTRHPE